MGICVRVLLLGYSSRFSSMGFVWVIYCTFNIGIRIDSGEFSLVFQAILRNISRRQGDVVTTLCWFGPTENFEYKELATH